MSSTMQIFLVVLICIVCVHGQQRLVERLTSLTSSTVRTNVSSIFHEWKTDHGKVYGNMETEAKRYETFRANLQYIEEHNKLFVLGQKSFYLGINEFTDMTLEEFRQDMHLDRLMQLKHQGVSFYTPSSSVKVPDMVDWRNKGYVTPVKNQGQCGSCWAFSTTGALEGLHFKKTGKLVPLSEQQLMDCTSQYGEKGCKGGLVPVAFNYTAKYGIESEAAYKYKAKTFRCSYKRSQVVANCTGYKLVKAGNESDLQRAVATQGPVSVSIDASHRSFQLYKGGVYNEPHCSTLLLDHAVLAVGYDTDKTAGDYWIVKNSWGSTWGEQGFVKMSRNKHNQCGIATYSSFPV